MTTYAHAARTTGPDEHLRAALLTVVPTSVVPSSVAEVVGQVLGADVRAPGFLPAFDNAAMDGYALRYADLAAAGRQLPLAPEIAAGPWIPDPLPSGAAAPIMTGAAIPRGADTVVPVEHTQPLPDGVLLLRDPAPGGHIRRRGEEHAPGDVLVAAGRDLRPVDAGLLAAAGVAQVLVHRRPRVAVLSTGAELVTPGAARTAGAVHDANTTLLVSLLRACGAEPTTLPSLPDDPHRLWPVVQTAARTHDLVVTAGGISAGTHEVVRQALTGHGVSFGRVAISPGSPQGRGHVEGTPLLALPGNPSAVLVSFAAFVRPVVRALSGRRDPDGGWTPVHTAAPLARNPGRTRFVPVVLEERAGRTLALECGNPHRLGGFAAADALLRIDPGDTELGAGSPAAALRL